MMTDILLVDDDAWLTAHVARNLSGEIPCRVRTVPNSIEAIDMIDEHRPDVIVLDMFMPGPNGVVLLHELQSHDDLATIPVILCSNSAADLPSKELSHYGVVATLDKTTMHPGDLIAAVRKVLL